MSVPLVCLELWASIPGKGVRCMRVWIVGLGINTSFPFRLFLSISHLAAFLWTSRKQLYKQSLFSRPRRVKVWDGSQRMLACWDRQGQTHASHGNRHCLWRNSSCPLTYTAFQLFSSGRPKMYFLLKNKFPSKFYYPPTLLKSQEVKACYSWDRAVYLSLLNRKAHGRRAKKAST